MTVTAPAPEYPNLYGRRALDFVAAIQGASSRDEIKGIAAAELQAYGLPFFISWSARRDGATSQGSVDLNTYPDDYLEYYLANDLMSRDPIKVAMRRSLSPLTWTEVLASFSWSKAERVLIEERRSFGATDGLTIPVLSGGLFLGFFSACGHDPDLSPEARSALHVVGMTTHQALTRLDLREERLRSRHLVSSHVALTPREREVVRWVASGKSNEDIGDILGIATATVKTMLARAQGKLNASGRTATVVQALRHGEIDLGG